MGPYSCQRTLVMRRRPRVGRDSNPHPQRFESDESEIIESCPPLVINGHVMLFSVDYRNHSLIRAVVTECRHLYLSPSLQASYLMFCTILYFKVFIDVESYIYNRIISPASQLDYISEGEQPQNSFESASLLIYFITGKLF